MRRVYVKQQKQMALSFLLNAIKQTPSAEADDKPLKINVLFLKTANVV